MKLIDKDAVVAEIERRVKSLHQVNSPREQAVLYECKDILSFINTLEIKDVDFEDTKSVFEGQYLSKDKVVTTIERLQDECEEKGDNDGVELLEKLFNKLNTLEVKEVGVWKTVDNINLPQADKNKIYCVFTKDRYILAKVINHPNDEELLQWKCTEFPNHRYDMYDGDKYMQIV